MREGRVVAVCVSPREGVPKYVQVQAVVAAFGLVGDYHCREMRPSFSKPGTLKPNVDRHISLFAKETLDAINKELGIYLRAGAVGENILTAGLGDLSDVAEGARIRIGESVRLVVTQQNVPCKNLRHYHPQFIKTIRGCRGLLCAVERGAGEIIQPGDPISFSSD